METMMQSAVCLLEQAAEKFKNKTVFEDKDGSISFEELREKSRIIGSELIKRVETGRKCPVIVYLPKSIKSIISFMGSLYSASPYVPIDYAIPMARMEKTVENLHPTAIITDTDGKTKLESLNLDTEILIFDELAREKYVDWFGYSASVSPYILEQFEKEVGYPFRAEYIIDQGYMNNTYRIPSKEFKDFQAFQRREVAKLAKEMVDIVHEYGKEAMMFMGDHWIGMEPFMDEFASIGLDAVVVSVGNGATLRLFSDIKNVKYTEGRFLPYFFPDTFHEGGDPVKEAKVNWVTARRAILRSPIQRIGYGGYLKLALEFPDFVQYIKEVCEEFRTLYDNIQGTTPYCVKRVAVLNCWGKMRSWGNHMVHHAIYYKQNYSYFGIIEALSGAPFDVSFISFDDIRENRELLKNFDVVINVGDADTAQSGGEYWVNETIITAVKEFVYNGGGFIGVGEPAAHQWQGHFFQLDDVLGVEEENGFNLNKDKYNWEEHRDHFILSDSDGDVDFGEGKKNIYALDGTEILIQKDQEVQMAVKTFGKGRGVYISGLPYSFKNSRVFYRAVLWSASAEEELHCWYSTNYNVEVHAYVKNGKYCVVNNTYEPQDTVVYRGDGSSFQLHMEANEIKWYQI